MSLFVIDASVAAKWFIPEKESPLALTLLNSKNQLHAPDFLSIEIDSLICKWIRRKLLSIEEGYTIRENLSQFPLKKHSALPLTDPAFLLAHTTQTHPYDCLYLATAFLLKGKCVTADKHFYRQIQKSPYKKYILTLEELAA